MRPKRRTPAVAFDDIPGELPNASVPKDVDLNAVARSAVIKLNSLDIDHLASNTIWRDLLAFTDYFRTFYSAPVIFTAFKKLSLRKKRSLFRIKEGREPRIGRSAKGSSWVDVDILFTAQHGNLAQNCMGTVSLCCDDDGRWSIWMLRTWLECFDGYGHPDVLESAGTVDHRQPTLGTGSGATHVADKGINDVECTEYGAIVVGAGQAGLAVAGRLQALGVPYILLDNRDEIGDVWNTRYESLRWHTSKEYGNLPFGHTYPEHDDYAMPTKRVGAGHKNWAEKYSINVRTNTTVESARWNNYTRQWIVTACRPDSKIVLNTKNLVLATGTGHATPIYPSWATAEKVQSSGFKGSVIHSFDGYHSAHRWSGGRGIVIGTANTAHDVAEDMANAGMETTMVQRNPTFVFPAEWLWHAEDRNYRADNDPAIADREEYTYPNKILRGIVNQAVHNGIRSNPERFDALERAGFKLDRFGDIYTNLYVRFGGHYVDIGGSARIVKGEIKVKTAAITGLTADGLAFDDGTELGADLIVLCTGFNHDFRSDAARILGDEIADQVDDFYGMDEEGEIRGHARPAGHPNLYYHGGDVRMARFFSRFIALQIQADVLSYPLEPYLD